MVKSSQTFLRGSALALAATLVMPVATTYGQNKKSANVLPVAETRAEKKGMQPGGYYGVQPAFDPLI